MVSGSSFSLQVIYISLECHYIVLLPEEPENLNDVYVFPELKRLLKILVLLRCILLLSSKVPEILQTWLY